MPKKKGLGRDINKSVEVMDGLLGNLREFSEIPIKRGLQSNGFSDEKLVKMINDASEKAHTLYIIIGDLKDAVSALKINKNSRFATQRVIERFIQSIS